MKNYRVLSVFVLLLLSVTSARATVYAIGRLVKGNQNVYLFSDVPQDIAIENQQRDEIVEKMRELNATLIFDSSYDTFLSKISTDKKVRCLNGALLPYSIWDEISNMICTLVNSIESRYISEGVTEAFKFLIDQKIDPNKSVNTFSDVQKKHLNNLFGNLLRDQLVDAVEKSENTHIFVYCSPIYAEQVSIKLKMLGWTQDRESDMIADFCKFYSQYSTVDLSQFATPININQWFEQLTNEFEGPAQEQYHPAGQKQNRSFFTKTDICVLSVGLISAAALTFVAIKNNFCGWLKDNVVTNMSGLLGLMGDRLMQQVCIWSVRSK